MTGKIRLIILLVFPTFLLMNCKTRMQETGSLEAETLIKELSHPYPSVRQQAVIKLAQLKYPPAVPGLIKLLGDQEINKLAAEALKTINDPRGLAAIEEHKNKVDSCGQVIFKENKPCSTNHPIGEMNLHKPIVLMSSEERSKKIEELWRLYRSEKESYAKERHLEMLAQLGDIRIFDELKIPDDIIRSRILGLLRFFHSENAVSAALRAISRHEIPGSLLSHQTYFSDPALADALLPFIDSRDKSVFALATRSIVMMNEKRAISRLLPRLLDKNIDIQEIARNALMTLEVLDRKDYIANLSSPDPARRYMACTKLEHCRAIKAIKPMIRIAFDSHPQVSEKAVEIISAWNHNRGHEVSPTRRYFPYTFPEYFLEPDFYVHFDQKLKELNDSEELKKAASKSCPDLKAGLKKIQILATLKDARVAALGQYLLQRFGADREGLLKLTTIMATNKNPSLNPSLIDYFLKRIYPFAEGNQAELNTLLQLIKETNDRDAIPKLVELIKTDSLLFKEKDYSDCLNDTAHILSLKNIFAAIFELGDMRIFPFITKVFNNGKGEWPQLARQVLLKIDYKATKDQLLKHLERYDTPLLEDLAEAAARQWDRRLAEILFQKGISGLRLIGLAELLPNDSLNSPRMINTINQIKGEWDDFWESGQQYYRWSSIEKSDFEKRISLSKILAKLNKKNRWQLCKSRMIDPEADIEKSWIRREFVNGGHSGADAFIAEVLADPRVRIESKLFACDLAGEKQSGTAVKVLVKWLNGRSQRLAEAGAKTLSRIGSKSALMALLTALDSKNYWTHKKALNSLIALDDSGADVHAVAQESGERIQRRWQDEKMKWQQNSTRRLASTWEDGTIIRKAKPASLAVISENEVSILRFDCLKNAYRAEIKREVPGVKDISAKDKAIFIAANPNLYALDKELNTKSTLNLPDVSAMTSAEDILLVAAGGHLITLDKDLQPLGEICLGIPGYTGEWKNAHSILAKKGCAYLLDNTMDPIYILQVDIHRPAEPKIVLNQEIYDINQHLEMQFLSNGGKSWNIMQIQVHEGGTFQNLLQISRESGDHIRRFECEIDQNSEENGKIIAITPDAPTWMVVAFGGHLTLTRFEKPYDFIAPVPSLYLGLGRDKNDEVLRYWSWSGFYRAHICQNDDLLYITINRQLWVVRSGETAQIILHQILDKPILKLAVLPE